MALSGWTWWRGQGAPRTAIGEASWRLWGLRAKMRSVALSGPDEGIQGDVPKPSSTPLWIEHIVSGTRSTAPGGTALCTHLCFSVSGNGVYVRKKDPVAARNSPGLQRLETRLSNSQTLSSGHSCRILERMYRSASGRSSLKKSPGVTTRRQESVRDAGPGPAPAGPRGCVALQSCWSRRHTLPVGGRTVS